MYFLGFSRMDIADQNAEIDCKGEIRRKQSVFVGLGLVADQPIVHYGGRVDSRFCAFHQLFHQAQFLMQNAKNSVNRT